VTSHHLNAARECNIGAGTVFLYVDRVIEALRSLAHIFVQWPNRARQKEIRGTFSKFGFPGAIGAIDGSLIQLADKPPKDAIYYYTRKKYYAVRGGSSVFCCNLLMRRNRSTSRQRWMM
jgi:hypothetical protein